MRRTARQVFTASAFYLIAGALSIATAQTNIPASCANISLGNLGALNGFVPSPTDLWHQNVSNAAIDPNSSKIVSTASDLLGAYLHPDFGTTAGIPYTVVDASKTPGVSYSIFNYVSDSDVSLYPIPANMPVEDSPGDCPTANNDRHAIILDRNQCVIYEMYQATSCSTSKPVWSFSNTAMWDMANVEHRPYGLTSVDAAGLSVFEGLIRYDEILAGVINHAIRFTATHTKNDQNNGFFTAPATHAAGTLWGTDNIMGMRIRLQANFDISGYSPTNQIILKAMKQYGMILADNGSNLFFQGTPDSRWNDDDLSALKVIPVTAFDVVQMNPVYDSATAPTGAAPSITSFKASSTTAAPGTVITLTPVVSGASYSYIDQVGFVRGPVTVMPSATTTYTLTSRNSFGTATATVTVTIAKPTANTPKISFAPIAPQTYGGSPVQVSANSPSTGAITYQVVSGPAIVAQNVVTLTGAGSVLIQANQAATSTYAAGSGQISFTINPGAPGLAFAPIAAQTYGTAPFSISTTSKSNGASSYSVVSGSATLAGNVVTLTGAGQVTLGVSQTAAGNYAAATAQTTFLVAPKPVKLTFSIPDYTLNSGVIALDAISTVPGSITYSLVSGAAVLHDTKLLPLLVGPVTVKATQAATQNTAGASVTATFQTLRASTSVLLKAAAASLTSVNNSVHVNGTSSPSSFTVQVVFSGKKAPTGQIKLLSGNKVLTTASLKATDAGELKIAIPVPFETGQYRVSASYSGDANYESSASPVTVLGRPSGSI